MITKTPAPYGLCFAAGTLIHTKEGMKPIEHIQVGDWVLTQPEETGERIYKRVTRTTQFEDAAVWTVTYFLKAEFEQARAEKRTMRPDCECRLVVTPNHPFWVRGKGWVQVKDLDIDVDELELADGQIALLSTVYPLYRTETEGVAWEEGMFISWDGTLCDLRQGRSGEKEFRTTGAPRAVQPAFVERWDESSFFRFSVYNIEVEDFHTYYVGELGVWVHNSNCSENSPSQMEQPMSAARRSTQAGGCLIKGTRVHTKEGLKPIKEIQIGDWVLSSPEDGSGSPEYKRVVRTFEHERQTIVRISIHPEGWRPSDRFCFIVATGNHPFWVDGIGWTRADALKSYQWLRQENGERFFVGAVEPVYQAGQEGIGWVPDGNSVRGRGSVFDYVNYAAIGESEQKKYTYLPDEVLASDDPYLRVPVFNIEVEDFHTYYVGAKGFWVHSANCDGQVGVEKGAHLGQERWADVSSTGKARG